MQELLDPLNGLIAYPVWISIYCKFVFDNQKQIHYNEIILKRRYESWTFTYVTETISGEVAWLGTLLDLSLLTPFSNGKAFI